MDANPISIEKQQQMLLRSLAEVHRDIRNALGSKVTTDFEDIKTSFAHLKQFVEDHVTAPEIRVYMSQIEYQPYIRGGSTPPFTFLGIKFGGSAPSRAYLADGRLIRATEELLAKLGNLEILVKMMGDD